jgi:N-acetylglucosamine-6-phosphate deacetylase
VGIHFEGPFISSVRRGAHPLAQIRKPSLEVAERLLGAAGSSAKVAVLAPELPRALELLKYFSAHGLRVGLGHSDATYGQTLRAIDAGATHGVHCYNGMRPFGHRDPGIVGAVLTDDRVSAELIADGVHVDPAAVRLLVKAKGLGRVILISDAVSAAGMPDGKYRLGGFSVVVTGGVCRNDDGNLAGSTVTLDAAVRNLAAFTGASFQSCLPCATLNPARLLGIEKRKGIIAAGADADLAVLDKNFYVTQTYVRGRPVL